MQEFLVEATPKDTLDVIEAEMHRAGYNTHGIPGRRSETSVTFTRPGGCLTGLFTDAPSAKFVASPHYSGESSVTRLTLETNDEAVLGGEARRIIIEVLGGQAV